MLVQIRSDYISSGNSRQECIFVRLLTSHGPDNADCKRTPVTEGLQQLAMRPVS